MSRLFRHRAVGVREVAPSAEGSSGTRPPEHQKREESEAGVQQGLGGSCELQNTAFIVN